jgi:hypothetical protein
VAKGHQPKVDHFHEEEFRNQVAMLAATTCNKEQCNNLVLGGVAKCSNKEL